MSWKKAFLISIFISTVIFILGYFVAEAFFILIMFITTIITIALGYKVYNDWNLEIKKYYYFGLKEGMHLEGLVESKSKNNAIKLARKYQIIILEIHLATDEEISKFKSKERNKNYV